MNLKEAFEILKSEGITKNIESVRRWIRSGELKATMKGGYKRGGYDVKEKDLKDFITAKKIEKSPGKKSLLNNLNFKVNSLNLSIMGVLLHAQATNKNYIDPKTGGNDIEKQIEDINMLRNKLEAIAEPEELEEIDERINRALSFYNQFPKVSN